MADLTALDRWVALFATRDEMAVEYASLLAEHRAWWPTWPALNLAIRDRWSEAGLRYVKRTAWRIAQETAACG